MEKEAKTIKEVASMNADMWNYEKADLEQGAWYRTDHAGDKIAVILPQDRAQSIEQGVNAWLHTRKYGCDEWQDRGTHSFDEAKSQGDEHCHQYARDLAQDLINQHKREQERDK